MVAWTNCFARRQFNVEPIVDIRQTQPLPNYSAVAYIRESSYVYFYIIGLFSKLSSSTRLVPENATIWEMPSVEVILTGLMMDAIITNIARIANAVQCQN